QRFKERLLAVTRNQVIDAAKRYFDDDKNHAVAVISSEERLKAANKSLADNPLRLHRI
ncbi:MAG: hypothetical protein JRJ46_15015, partial [Deltaproteobacteria bacterium]|nr:hypothetical protein [Deltaproteobacteria bacterium]